MENAWHNLHITDKAGGKHFNTIASPLSTASEIKNLQQHLDQAKKHPQHYKFLDIATAVIMLDEQPYKKTSFTDLSADDLSLLDDLLN